MIIDELKTNKRRLRYSVSQIQYIIGLIIFSLLILLTFHNILTLKWRFQSSVVNSLNGSLFRIKSTTELVLLYEEKFSRVETTSFWPTFHNHHLTLKLNLTSMGIELIDYFLKNSKRKIDHLKIIFLQNSRTMNDSYPICEIYLTFHVEILNLSKVNLIFSSKNVSCSLLLTNTSEIISIDINRFFPSDDLFRFSYQWSGLANPTLISWPRWPLTSKCLNSYLNNSIKNRNQSTKVEFESVECSQVNVLMHSTSRELFTNEQNAVSHWLDLQYKIFVEQGFSSGRNQSLNKRNLVPFEIAKNCSVCSKKFQNWILNYQQWHENVSFHLNNGSMTIEEQRNRLIELDVRLLIYEKHTSGIADRIVHLITTYLVALLTKRLFIFDKNWPEFQEILQLSLNCEQNLVLPWFTHLDLLNLNLSQTNPNYLTSKTQWFSFDRFTKDYDYDKTFPERILIFQGHTGGVIHTIKSNSSIYRQLLTVDLEMNTNNIFGCLYHSLFTYKLSELIKRVSLTFSNEELGHSSQQILRTLLSPIFFPIGVQIRVGDQTMTETNIDQSQVISSNDSTINKYQNFFTCARNIINEDEKLFNKTGKIPIIFLLSDSFQVRRSALRRWQLSFECFQSFRNECKSNNHHLHILSSANPVFHVTYTNNPILAFQLGMFDTFLFGLCQQHLITKDSGFGRFPAFAALKQRNLYSLGLNEQKSCKNQSLQLGVAGYHWSAI